MKKKHPNKRYCAEFLRHGQTQAALSRATDIDQALLCAYRKGNRAVSVSHAILLEQYWALRPGTLRPRPTLPGQASK